MLTRGVAAQYMSDTDENGQIVAWRRQRDQRRFHRRMVPLMPTGFWMGPGVDDGLNQTEAVAIALWNNADFQASLTDLGFARADLVEAGLLRNPVLSLLFPVGPKRLEATLKWPIETLWERPLRIRGGRIRPRSRQEVEHPMAVVIVGALFTSTVLNLFLLPALFLRYGAANRPPVSPVE